MTDDQWARLVYDEVMRARALQDQRMDSYRTRSTALISALAVAAGLFARPMEPWTVAVAAGAFGLLAGAVGWIHRPVSWMESPPLVNEDEPADLLTVAGWHQENLDTNERLIANTAKAFLVALAAAGAMTVVLLVEAGGT